MQRVKENGEDVLVNVDPTELKNGHLDIPQGVTKIAPQALRGLSELTSVTFPAGLKTIGDGAFLGCTGLTQLTFPAGLASIVGVLLPTALA